MKYIMPFLENSIVIAWIAPIVTTLVTTIIIKKISLINDSKVISTANQDCINTILLSAKKNLEIDIEFIHSVRSALALELGVPERKLYSDSVLRDVLVNHLAKDTSISSNDRLYLINKTLLVFNNEISGKSENGKAITVSKKHRKYLLVIIIISFAVSIIIYVSNPAKASDPNSIQAFFLGCMQPMTTLGIMGIALTSLGLEITIKKEQKFKKT